MSEETEETPEQARARRRVLTQLEALSVQWGEDCDVAGIARLLSGAPPEKRQEGIENMLRQSFIEGAYRGYLAQQLRATGTLAPRSPNGDPVLLSG